MPKFKIGQKVICIKNKLFENEYGYGWKENKIFKINKINTCGKHYTKGKEYDVYFDDCGFGVFEYALRECVENKNEFNKQCLNI